MVIIVLSFILAISLLLIGGKRGLKTIATLLLNIIVFFIMASIMIKGISPVICAVIGCIAICIITLFINCGINAKSISSFFSVAITVVLIWILVEVVGRGARIEGFSFQKLSEIAGYSWIININMADVAVACILFGLIGAITDTSIAVSSASFEVAQNNPNITFSELYTSGLYVGRDILGTTCNTLYFAFLGGYMTMLIMFTIYNYSFETIINGAAFVEEFLRIMTSMFGCVLIVPISSLFTSLLLKTRLKIVVDKCDDKVQKVKDYINKEPEEE